MANIYRGEVALNIGNKTYIMRPSFHTICSIEGRLKKSVVTLIKQTVTKGLLASDISAILQSTTDLNINSIKIDEVYPAVYQFLLNALCISEEEIIDLDEVNWLEMLQIAVRNLNIPPQSFWDMTMPEYRAILNSYLTTTPNSLPITREELAKMLENYPDLLK
jgi:hypothetical protein